ncbi:MAG: lysylphosphatidylglycerol synthase transmembrane domain-containing protein, partial [Pseudomonadota bacterium]
MARSRTFFGIQILVTLSLVILVLWMTGLFSEAGRLKLFELFKQADFFWLIMSVLIGVLTNMSSSFKWFLLIRAKQHVVGFWRVFSYYLIGQFYNLFLPTSVGGDVVRSFQLGRFINHQADALASVFVERYTGILMLFVFAAGAVVLQASTMNVDYIIIALLSFALVLSLIAWLVFDPKPYQWLRKLGISWAPKSAPIFLKLDSLVTAVSTYR